MEKKTIYLSGAVAESASSACPPPPPRTKKITTKKIWSNVRPEDLEFENQARIIDTVVAGCGDEKSALTMSLIKQKIASYKCQDLLKKKYSAAEFICVKDVLDLIVENKLICHYCKQIVLILYENIREPRQWSLDRIDNTMGHNRGNLYLSCLSCNLRRRCMYPERYVFTKKCAVVKKLGRDEEPAAAAEAAAGEHT